MLGTLFRFFLGRRLARFLPGGWLGFLLLSPTARRLAGRGWRAFRSRRGGSVGELPRPR